MSSEKNTILIFGYGSLMNDDSRLRSAPCSTTIDRDAVLQGYQRIFNISYGDHVYANIHQHPDYQVVGTVMEVTREGFDALCTRERNYEMVDVSRGLVGEWNQPVYAFIGENNTTGNETIKQSYIDLCLSGIVEGDREQWLVETVMEFPVNKTA